MIQKCQRARACEVERERERERWRGRKREKERESVRASRAVLLTFFFEIENQFWLSEAIYSCGLLFYLSSYPRSEDSNLKMPEPTALTFNVM